MSCGRSRAVLVLLCLLAADAVAGDAGARVERCSSAAPADMRCPAKADPGRARRRSRAQLPSEDSTIYPKGLEKPATAVPPPSLPQPAPPLPSPAPITSCDPNGCRDSAGNRYNGWGPGMIRSDGKLCQQVGNMMQCN